MQPNTEVMNCLVSVGVKYKFTGCGVTPDAPLLTAEHAMTRDRALQILREHEAEFKAKGVTHLRLFGSVARDEANEESDVDVMVDFDPEVILTLWELSSVRLDLCDLLATHVDLVREKTMKPQIRERALREAVLAF